MTPRVAALADQGPIEIEQDDTFFRCERGRLKLRAFSVAEGQLIFYRRPVQAGPKESFFVISPTASPDSLREALSLAFGIAGRVRKHRTLYLVGRTRVHLDQVETLGHFLELEVVLREGESGGGREGGSRPDGGARNRRRPADRRRLRGSALPRGRAVFTAFLIASFILAVIGLGVYTVART